MNNIELTTAEKEAYNEFLKAAKGYDKESRDHRVQLWAEIQKIPQPWTVESWSQAWANTDVGAFNSDPQPSENGDEPAPPPSEENAGDESDEGVYLTDERIVHTTARFKEWAGVFGEKYADFIVRSPGNAGPENFCKLLARFTANHKQMERILHRSVYVKIKPEYRKPFDTYITTALEEAKKNSPLFDTSDRANIIWMWDGYLPLGKLVVIDGDPGLAKSMLSLGFGVSVMYGKPFLNGGKPAVTGGVILLSAEDDPKDTIAPRLMAAGAPDGKIPMRFQPATKADGEPFNLASVADRLELELMIMSMDAKLVIIDPLNSYLGEKVDSHNDQKVRQVLSPLSEIANRTGCTIVCLRHVNKSGGGKAIYRGMGSIAYTAAARANYYVAEHPDHNGTFVFAWSKGNLSVRPPSLVYRIATKKVDGIEKPVPYVVGVGTTDLTADQLASSQDQTDEAGKLDEAIEFLKLVLEDGPQTKALIEAQSSKQGIKPITLRRAKDALKVVAKQEGRKWYWRLPEQKQEEAKAKQAALF